MSGDAVRFEYFITPIAGTEFWELWRNPGGAYLGSIRTKEAAERRRDHLAAAVAAAKETPGG